MDAPYFPFYPGDWLSDGNVKAMTLEESGAYITLLCHMWIEGDGCSLPDDDRFLARLLKLSTKRWKNLRFVLVDGVGAVFYTEDGRIHNPRMDREYRAVVDKIAKARDAANVRWTKKTDADAMRMHSERNADASPEHSERNAIREVDLDKEKRSKDNYSTARVDDVEIVSTTKTLAKLFPRGLSATARHDIESFVNEGLEPEMLTVAHEISVHARATNKPTYMAGVLRGFLDDGIRTLEDLKKREVDRATEKARPNSRGKPMSAATNEKDPRYGAFYELFPDA